MNFEQLIHSIEATHVQLSSQAVKQVNSLQTIRNWLIGCYIVEFEQNGEDRAAYGSKLIENTAKKLSHIRGMAVSNLRNFRQFYLTYQWFFPFMAKQTTFLSIHQTASGELEKREIALALPIETLMNTLSFSHFIELLRLDSDLKRRFYEVEAVKNAWKVRELERAIDTLLFERTEYATAGLENELFVSKYMLQLPDKETLRKFIEAELNH